MFGDTYIVSWTESDTNTDHWMPYYSKEEAFRDYHWRAQCIDCYSVSICAILKSTDYPYEPKNMEVLK